MRLPRLSFLAAFACVADCLGGASLKDRVEILFRPPLGEKMALSPDGQRLAYTMHARGDLSIVIVGIDHPSPRRTVAVEWEHDAGHASDQAPLQLRFLRWATANRLVFAPPERVVPLPPLTGKNGRPVPNPDGPTIFSPIFVVDADGKQRGTLIDACNFQETPEDARRTLADLLRTTKELVATRNEPVRWRMPHLDILGFLPRDREQLILQTRGAYSKTAQHLIDTRTGSVSEFGDSWPSPPGQPQVFDAFRLKVVGEHTDAARPTTRWHDSELGSVQQELELKFPRRVVEMLDWTETRARILFRVTGGSDPGRVFVYQRTENIVLEVLRCAPWLSAAKLADTRLFEFESPDGGRLSGYLTWPKTSRVEPPPLLVILPSGFPGRAHLAFDPEAEIFADLGFAVARLNHRSVAGVRAEDLNALRASVDRLAVEDARTAIEWLAARMPDRPFDQKRVATLGRGFGGYLAVRALQLQPATFRCAIAMDAPMDLRSWLRSPVRAATAATEKETHDIPVGLIDHEGRDWKTLSVLDQADALTQPVFLLHEPGRSPSIDVSTNELRRRLEALGRPPHYLELDRGFAAHRTPARAAVYGKIAEFLNLRLNDYAVKIGPAKEVE